MHHGGVCAHRQGGNLAERKKQNYCPAKELCRRLLKYAKANGIERGHIFRTRSGRPLDRSTVCHDMTKLCRKAGVDSRKVFPHSLRHLFARSFIAVEKNLAHLADILGHSRIETTRIYVAVSAASHERILQRMNLIL
ncbi:MAG: tyrosine-type recombinase/integrase [Neglectibacter sp.]